MSLYGGITSDVPVCLRVGWVVYNPAQEQLPGNTRSLPHKHWSKWAAPHTLERENKVKSKVEKWQPSAEKVRRCMIQKSSNSSSAYVVRSHSTGRMAVSTPNIEATAIGGSILLRDSWLLGASRNKMRRLYEYQKPCIMWRFPQKMTGWVMR